MGWDWVRILDSGLPKFFMIGYKVVRSYKGTLYSCNWKIHDDMDLDNHISKGHIIEYALHEVSRPNPGAGPLCVFTDIQYAKRYINNVLPESTDIIIFKCQYNKSVKKHLYFGKDDEKIVAEDMFASIGLICIDLASSVQLLEQV